jgi:hypothetical protein
MDIMDNLNMDWVGGANNPAIKPYTIGKPPQSELFQTSQQFEPSWHALFMESIISQPQARKLWLLKLWSFQ